MRILLTDAGKRYNREWIFRHVHQEFKTGESYAITGPNGSGKSTLLQLIAGAILPSEGTLEMLHHEPLKPEDHFRHISIAAPYLELVEEMTALEFLQFHAAFKPFLDGLTPAAVAERVGLSHAAGKQIRQYSSGMKQRLKLAQCILTDTAFVLLDEPCTNLDQPGIELYLSLVREYAGNRCVIISSNDMAEYGFCRTNLDVLRFKP
jgi:ABC-type multidrug transport system ATPase subunit